MNDEKKLYYRVFTILFYLLFSFQKEKSLRKIYEWIIMKNNNF